MKVGKSVVVSPDTLLRWRPMKTEQRTEEHSRSNRRWARAFRMRIVGLVLLLLFLASCKKQESARTPLARVDNETLTLEFVRSMLDSASHPTPAQIHEFTQRWIVNELLYREALRRSLHESPDVQARVESARRQLLVGALLDEVARSAAAEPGLDEITRYYADHKNDFVLSQDVVLLSLALFREREAANAFRTAVLRATPWASALQQIQSDSLQATSLVARVDSAYHTASTLLPVELWRVASIAQRGEPSFPIRTDDGFYCLIVWKQMRAGQIADLEYVNQDIRNRLLMERRRQAIDSLVENLRSRHIVEVLADGVSSDTVRPKE